MTRLKQHGGWDPALQAKALEVLALRYSEPSDSLDFAKGASLESRVRDELLAEFTATFFEATLEVLDFARCQRADGTFYGTGGQCRKGKEVGERERAEKLQAKKPQRGCSPREAM
jgi:hypothetical protein